MPKMLLFSYIFSVINKMVIPKKKKDVTGHVILSFYKSTVEFSRGYMLCDIT